MSVLWIFENCVWLSIWSDFVSVASLELPDRNGSCRYSCLRLYNGMYAGNFQISESLVIYIDYMNMGDWIVHQWWFDVGCSSCFFVLKHFAFTAGWKTAGGCRLFYQGGSRRLSFLASIWWGREMEWICSRFGPWMALWKEDGAVFGFVVCGLLGCFLKWQGWLRGRR